MGNNQPGHSSRFCCIDEPPSNVDGADVERQKHANVTRIPLTILQDKENQLWPSLLFHTKEILLKLS